MTTKRGKEQRNKRPAPNKRGLPTDLARQNNIYHPNTTEKQQSKTYRVVTFEATTNHQGQPTRTHVKLDPWQWYKVWCQSEKNQITLISIKRNQIALISRIRTQRNALQLVQSRKDNQSHKEKATILHSSVAPPTSTEEELSLNHIPFFQYVV